MNIHNSAVGQALSWLVTLLVPIVIVLTVMRAIMNPFFLQFEYNLPGFPPDPYGFTKEERLYWSRIDLDYLLNDADISFLGDLRFQDGAPVYNQRELRHMVDVKIVVRGALLVWYVSLGGMLVLGIWAWRGGWMDEFRQGLARGGRLTTLLLGAIVLFVLFGFGIFFVAFHDVFFPPGTWMFEFSDTLIRLFPEFFWRVIFTLVGAVSLGAGLALAFLFRRR